MDDIQRKLRLIDEQLSGGRDFHKKIVTTTPLLFLAVGLIAGIILQQSLHVGVWFWFILSGFCVAVTILYLVFFKSPFFEKVNSTYVAAYLAMICFMCVGGVRLAGFYHLKPDDIANLAGQERTLATIRGIIVTEPYVRKTDGWKFGKFQFADPGSSFYLDLKEAKSVDQWVKASGTVKVYIDEPAMDLKAGDIDEPVMDLSAGDIDEPAMDLKAGDFVQIDCRLGRFNGATNPGQFDTAKYLARKNILVGASVESRDGIEVLKDSGKGFFAKLRQKLREKANQALVNDGSLEETSEGLLKALLLGYRGDIGSDTYEAFRRTGLLHFISLSGMHLGIFVGIVWWLCKTAGLLKKWRAGVCIAAVIIFLLIVPTRPPTLRAAVISIVFCVSFFFRRKSSSINTLSLAAIILLLIRPTDLFEAGWQLSFASVLGILLFCQRILFFLYEKITGRSWLTDLPRTRPFFQIIPRPGPYALQLLSTGIAAWLGGAGVLLYHFYSVTPLTSIWTVIVFPLIALILTVGYLKLVLAFLLPTTAMFLGMLVNEVSRFLIWIVALLAKLDISQILIGHVPLWLIVFYYCFILAIVFVNFRRPLLKKVLCTVMALVIVVFLTVTKYQMVYRDDLVMTTLDVGHGQAIVMQLPGRANLLFDAGSIGVSDVGNRIVRQFLDYSGINRLDAIFISHGDIDHINGIPEIAEHCSVKKVYINKAFFEEKDEYGTSSFLIESLSDIGSEVQVLEKELDFKNNAKVKPLWPIEQQIKMVSKLSDNDKSSVSLIEYAGQRILLTSDIGKIAQREFLKLYPELKPEIVVVPHHGSVNTLEPDFPERLDADILICSCGRREFEKLEGQRFGNSSKQFFTYRDGAITVSIDRSGKIKTSKFRIEGTGL